MTIQKLFSIDALLEHRVFDYAWDMRFEKFPRKVHYYFNNGRRITDYGPRNIGLKPNRKELFGWQVPHALLYYAMLRKHVFKAPKMTEYEDIFSYALECIRYIWDLADQELIHYVHVRRAIKCLMRNVPFLTFPNASELLELTSKWMTAPTKKELTMVLLNALERKVFEEYDAHTAKTSKPVAQH